MPTRDDHHLRRILVRARSMGGATWPNPTVAAAIVSADGDLLAEGLHRGPGRDHAEVAAIEAAGSRAPAGATMFVTLEPCNHQGRTPPCTEAILRAGIARVVIASEDDNPQVHGGGAAALREAGVQVDFAGEIWRQRARALNPAFVARAGAAEAFVTLKLALSREGKLARRFGRVESAAERAISGALAHRRAHRLRAEASCVVVGKGTVLADRPRLDVRLVDSLHRPRPVVLDSHLELDPSILPVGALVAHAEEAEATRRRALEALGHESLPIARGPSGLSWQALLGELAGRNLGSVLVEGGAEVARSLVQSGLADRIHVFQAPLSIPGPAPEAPALPPPGYELCRQRRLGPDLEIVYRRSGANGESARL